MIPGRNSRDVAKMLAHQRAIKVGWLARHKHMQELAWEASDAASH